MDASRILEKALRPPRLNLNMSAKGEMNMHQGSTSSTGGANLNVAPGATN